MADNIGIDFGSTFSSFASYDKHNDRFERLTDALGNGYIPSVACMHHSGRRLLFGRQVQTALANKPWLQTYRGFKMLLHVAKPEDYRKHGYIQQTPTEVATQFLESYLIQVANKIHADQFDNAVICVPEHWIKRSDQMSGRSILLNICRGIQNKGMPLLKNIRVVSEPVAATAYFAHNYKRTHGGKPFEGDVLIVDYGGGTLDITLTTVTVRKDAENDGTMEIDVGYRTGCGQNSENKIGDAGLAYMEGVTREALKNAGIKNPQIDGKFMQAKDMLEEALMLRVPEIQDWIEQQFKLDIRDIGSNSEVFLEVDYGAESIEITYGMLYNVFQKIIQPVLERYLNEIREYLKTRKTPYKVAVVGGFGEFPLVQYAIRDFLDATDGEMDFALEAEGWRRDAVSYGAALIAAGQIHVQPRSPYGIGLRILGNNIKFGREAIEYRQLVPDRNKVYPLGGAWKDPLTVQNSDDPKNAPWVFSICQKTDSREAIEMTPRSEVHRELREKLRRKTELLQLRLKDQGVNEPIRSYYFGFSMDESLIYTLHIYAAHPLTLKRIENESIKEELGNFLYLFGSTVSLNPNEDRSNVLIRENNLTP